ncbi:MAG: right-handed parallel beta-helix repeat-containing protein [Bacillaceae bacterium]|nr:right-handed parallel beta-helix repeat-containing protein [Bacillaceae bacterium]
MYLLLLPVDGSAEGQNELQRMIDEATPGDVLTIPSGHYTGPIVISKPITLKGNGEVVVQGNNLDVVVYIAADQVTLEGLTIEHQSKDKDTMAVLVEGDGHQLTGLTVQTDGYGIVLRDAHQSEITKNTIKGNAENERKDRQNGIDLFGSHDNVIKGNDISYVHDGVYLERSEDNDITDNTVTHSRYGYHLMFTEGTRLTENISEQNVTGAMVMGTRGTVVSHNQFRKQLKHVFAQGLLLYDVLHAEVHHNHIHANLVGIFIQDSQENKIYQNEVAANYIGVQMLNAKDNHIYENQFVANVVSAQAQHSSNNQVKENYWDNHMGLDLDGDERSDIPYRADPFFYTIVKDTPAFQIFFQAPGMTFLENILKSDTSLWLEDAAPRKHPVLDMDESSQSVSIGLLAFSALLLLFSMYIIYYGGKRKNET